MKKLLSFLFASLVIIACSDENPSSGFEDTGKMEKLPNFSIIQTKMSTKIVLRICN